MTDSILFSWESLQPTKLFEGLPALLGQWQSVVVTISFLVIVGGHAWQHFGSASKGQQVMREWYLTLLTVAFVLASPVLLRLGLELAETLEESLPEPSPADVTRRCARLATAFPEIETLLRSDPSESKEATPTLFGYADGLWYDVPLSENETDPWLEDLEQRDPAREAATNSGTGVQAQSLLAAYVATNVSLSAAACFAWFMDTVRFLGVHLLSLVAPLAIASLRTHALRAQGLRTLLLLASLLLWPVLWSVGHMGTGKLFDLYVQEYEGIDSSSGDSSLSWRRIDTSFEADSAPVSTGMPQELGAQLPVSWLLGTTLHAFGLACWVAVVTIGLPLFLNRTLLKGATYAILYPR